MNGRYENDRPILVETTAYRDFKTAVDWVTDILCVIGFVIFLVDALALLLWELELFFYVKPADVAAFNANRKQSLLAKRLHIYMGIFYLIILMIIAFIALIPIAAIMTYQPYTPTP